jgi:hypothetical protein
MNVLCAAELLVASVALVLCNDLFKAKVNSEPLRTVEQFSRL